MKRSSGGWDAEKDDKIFICLKRMRNGGGGDGRNSAKKVGDR